MRCVLRRISPILIAIGLLVSSLRAGPIDSLSVITTEHYLIHTDIEPVLADDLAKRMEAMYAEYSRRLERFSVATTTQPDAPGDPVHPNKLEALLFAGKDEYDAFTHHMAPNTGGFFTTSPRPLLAAYLGDRGRDNLRRVLQHEAFHQFAYFAISRDLPVWLNEGMAQIFEEGIWTGNAFTIGEIPAYRVHALQQDQKSGRLLSFDTLFAMSHQEWRRRVTTDVKAGPVQYNEAWAIIQYLSLGPGNNRPRLIAWLSALHQGQDPAISFAAAFPEGTSLLQSRFMQWARIIGPTPHATMVDHEKVLADFLISFKTKGKTFDSIAAFRAATMRQNSHLQYTRGQVAWTTEDDPAVYFCDAAGRALPRDRLFFAASPGAPLPDLVYRDLAGGELRTRFYASEHGIDSETLSPPPR